ncbi:CoA-acylating methylmalonate-semialdehyde dehydrogenase [Actinomycetota bacterium]
MIYDTLKNYINGEWTESSSTQILNVYNPATSELIAKVPMSTIGEVESAISVAKEAFAEWRETPPLSRARYFFRLKELMEENFEGLAKTIVEEEGKTIDEARGEIRRAIENVEIATGISSLMMGNNLEDVATGIDEFVVRQPLGVFCAIVPFNFPFMVSLWFLPCAVACGNTYIVKSSEQAPISQIKLFELLNEAGFPPGVVNLLNGSKEAAKTLVESPDIEGVSFVGTTKIAKEIYGNAAKSGKRAQCQGGAKNFIVVMPDADLDSTVPGLISSFYGCAGERCLAGSVLLAVGDIYLPLKEKFLEEAAKIKVGYGLDETTQMGPVVSKKHKAGILSHIERGMEEGAKLILDGRNIEVKDFPNGNFIGPTIFDEVMPEMTIANEEIFGPVVSIMKAKDLEEAIKIIQSNKYGNASSIFTSSGINARKFRYEVNSGNIGINIGIAAPMAFFPFSGMKDSFFGDLHGQGTDAIDFFTNKKVVIERWI